MFEMREEATSSTIMAPEGLAQAAISGLIRRAAGSNAKLAHPLSRERPPSRCGVLSQPWRAGSMNGSPCRRRRDKLGKMASQHRLWGTTLALVTAFLCAGCGGSGETSQSSGGTAGAATTGATGGGGSSTSTSGQGGGAGQSGGATSGTTGNPVFTLEVHTQVTPEKSLALTTNLPAAVDACLAAPFEGTPCDDLDQDGLADAWEEVIIDRFRPLLRFDEAESLISDSTFVVADVARVALVSQSPLRARVFIMLGYTKDFGSCGFTAHNGDSERVALDLMATAGGGPGDVTAAGMYTAAHENTASDHSRKFEGADQGQLVYENDGVTSEPRWVVFPSQDKHGTYASIEICENISFVPCFDEDCGPDGVANPQEYDLLPPFINAGEEAHPLVTDLSMIGFPGDDAWAEQDFCGGLGGATCSAPVRDKLLNDPFGP